jgi:glycosyltransferase involved in cell wall biosynthesis
VRAIAPSDRKAGVEAAAGGRRRPELMGVELTRKSGRIAPHRLPGYCRRPDRLFRPGRIRPILPGCMGWPANIGRSARHVPYLRPQLRVVVDMVMSTGSTDVQRPIVSILMIAYNVEAWIATAIDSVLLQDVNFDYELVIGEDCSTDGTRAIVEQYAARHPGRIRAILRPRNLGMNANFFATLGECKGRYVALLDGDDYCSHPLKLRRQVEFLESHPDYAICFHNADVVYAGDEEASHPFHMTAPDRRLSAPIPKETSSLEDIALGNFMQTGSVVFRAGLADPLPAWFHEMPTFDWPLHVANARHGNIRYMDEIWSVYRVHEGGVWSSDMSLYRSAADVRRMVDAYSRLDDWLGHRFGSQIRRQTRWLHWEGMTLSYEAGEVREGNAHAARYLDGLTLPQIVAEWRALLVMARANLRLQGRRST